MANWREIVLSGSNAKLSSLEVDTTASVPYLSASVLEVYNGNNTGSAGQFLSSGTDGLLTWQDVNQSSISNNSYYVTWDGSGLDFTSEVHFLDFFGNTVTAPETSITLDAADATNPRIDLIVFSASNASSLVGTIEKITGTPAASPAEPNYQLNSAYPLKFILVNATATTPSSTGGNDFENNLIYSEKCRPS